MIKLGIRHNFKNGAQIASFSQKAVSAITGSASQVGEIISEGRNRSNEVIESIREDTQNLLNNLTAGIGIQNQRVEKKVEVPPKKPSTPHLETPTEPLTRSNSVVSDTNPPDSNSVISNQTSSSTSSFFKRAFSILTRRNSRSSNNNSDNNLSSSRHSDSDGSINSQDSAKSSLEESLASTTSNHVIFSLASGALSSIGDALMFPIKWLGSQISSLVSERNNQLQPKITTSKKETNNTLSSNPIFDGLARDERRWLIIKGWFNGHTYEKEIPISSPRLGTPDDWSSSFSNLIYSVGDSVNKLGGKSSRAISGVSESIASNSEESSSSLSFTALSSGSGALYKYTKSGLRNVASSIQTAGSSIAKISQYQSSSSWKNSFSWGDLPQIDLSNLTRSASNSVSGTSRSLRGVNLGRGVSRASSWAGDVAHKGGKFIERHTTTQHPINFSQTASDGWASMVSGVSNIRRSLPDIGASIKYH